MSGGNGNEMAHLTRYLPGRGRLPAKSRLIRIGGITCWIPDPDNESVKSRFLVLGGFGPISRDCMFILFSFVRSLSGSRCRRLRAALWTVEQPGFARLCAETDRAGKPDDSGVPMTIRQQPSPLPGFADGRKDRD